MVFYPAIGVPVPSDAKKNQLTADDVKTNVLKPALDNIEAGYPLYDACVYDVTAPASECDPTSAAILVTTQVYADPKPADVTKPQLLISMRSFDMINGRAIATVTLQSVDVGALLSSGAATVLKSVALTAGQIALLLGTPSVTSGKLSLFQGYEPYIQLVPTLVKADDPTYLPLLATLLDRRGLPSVPSQFNAGAVASGSTPLDQICGRGQRYFVYSVTSEDYSHPVSFSTRVETHASGQLFDCTDMTVLPVGLDQHLSVLTTKSPLASLIAILSAAFISKTNSWSGTLKVGTLVSGFVDSSPDSLSVRDSVSDRALQGLVDNLCTTLENQPTTAPPPLPLITVRVENPPSKQTKQQAQAVADVRLAYAQVQRMYFGTSAQLSFAVSNLSKKLQIAKAVGVRTESLDALIVKEPAGVVPAPAPAPAAPNLQPAAAGATLAAIDVSGFIAPSPPPLKCHAPRLDHEREGVNAADKRWTTLH